VGSLTLQCFGEKLRAAGRRHNAIAIDLTSDGIKTANVGMKSTGNLMKFLFTQKAGTCPAQYSIALQVRHLRAPFYQVQGGL
jgi:hypothetical protein